MRQRPARSRLLPGLRAGGSVLLREPELLDTPTTGGRLVIETKARACDGKKRHDDQRGAEAHRLRLIRRGAAACRLKVYRCRWCKGWHVGHVAGTRRRTR